MAKLNEEVEVEEYEKKKMEGHIFENHTRPAAIIKQKTLTKKASLFECDLVLHQEQISQPLSTNKISVGNGHLVHQLTDSEPGSVHSCGEDSSGSTEIISVRQGSSGRDSRRRRENQIRGTSFEVNQIRSEKFQMRSSSADRILEDDFPFIKPLVVDQVPRRQQQMVRQASDGSYLSWQESEDSCQDSSFRQDSSFQLPIRPEQSVRKVHDSLSTIQDSYSMSLLSSPIPLSIGRTSYTSIRARSSLTRLGLTRSRHCSDNLDRSRLRHSSDFLDRLARADLTQRSRLDQVEPGLYIGNMDAATDVLSLEGHCISHIVTVDSVPLPRKITSLLPRLYNLHLQVTDIVSEDLLSHFPRVMEFISHAMEGGGVVLVHCFYGKSRSATIVTAFLMHKYKLSLTTAMEQVRASRKSVNPNPGFMAQLSLWEAMGWRLDKNSIRYKLYKLHIVSEKIRKSKILSIDVLNTVIDRDPAERLQCSVKLPADRLQGSSGKLRGASVVYKCKQCRRTLATSENVLPHQPGVNSSWTTVNNPTTCSQSVFLNPMFWMEDRIRSSLSGQLLCPQCQTRIGSYSWVLGTVCPCSATVSPSFHLDLTSIIFKTRGRHLTGGSSGRTQDRRPVLV